MPDQTENTEPGTGSEPQIPSGSAANVPAGQETSGQPSGGDYTERERSFQSRADSAEAGREKVLKLIGGEDSALARMLGQYGADTVATVVNNYTTIRGDERLGKVIQKFEQTGEIPRSSADSWEDEDEFKSDEQKEIDTLKSEVAGLTRSNGLKALNDHLETAREKFFLTEEEFKSVSEGIASQMPGWMSTDHGKKFIRDIQAPDQYPMVETLVYRILNDKHPDVIFQLGDRKNRRDSNRRETFRTDGPSRIPTKGDEPPPEFKGPNAWVEALKYHVNRS